MDEIKKTGMPSKWIKNAALVAGTIAVVYLMIYVDVRSRAREAFQEGVRYESWYNKPDIKKDFLEKKFTREKVELDNKLAKGKLTEQVYRQDLEILEFDHEQGIQESSIKYAYQWYKDTYELFSPPESVWVRKARLLAPAMKQKWREELREKNIPFEEYMLDLEPGEDDKRLSVFSTKDGSLSEKLKNLLNSSGIDCVIFDERSVRRIPAAANKLIVSAEQFWQAQDIVKKNLKEFSEN